MAKVLIVDDEPNIVLSLEFLMRKDGHEVQSAPDGALALAGADLYVTKPISTRELLADIGRLIPEHRA